MLISFYLVLTVGVILTFSVYFWTGNTSSTVLPCMGTTWYKTYTGFLIADSNSYSCFGTRDKEVQVWDLYDNETVL